MQTDVKLSTKFLTTQNAHQVGLLVTLSSETPPRRAPINLALVLDRSGSMEGEPLHAAKQAAIRLTEFLGPADRLSVTIFDDQVETIFGPVPAGTPGVQEAIAAVFSRNSTNLSAGWLKGREHVDSGLVDGTNRVVLFTDGMANQGITEIPRLVGLSRGAASARVTTSCIGFGPQFNEELLRDMSAAGGGNYWYIETTDRMTDIFSEEIEGLVALAAQNVTIAIRPVHPQVAGVSLLQRYPAVQTADSWVVTLGDLYATSPRALGAIMHVENVAELGKTQVAEVRVTSDAIIAEGVEHQVVTLPIVANLDETDHVEPVVERTFVEFQAARAREEAVQEADRGDFDAASVHLLGAAHSLHAYRADPEVAAQIADLEAEAARMKEGDYLSADRKYHLAMGRARHEWKAGYLGKLMRKRPPREK
jgi:Ca-activated chloride channel family protein